MWILINPTCIMPNFCRTILQCDRAIGPTVNYKKWDLIWCPTFLWTIIIEHGFISDFIFMVKYFTIFVDIIFINLCLFFWRINSQSTLCFIKRIISRPILIGPDYKILTYFLLREFLMLLYIKCPAMGHLCQHKFL